MDESGMMDGWIGAVDGCVGGAGRRWLDGLMGEVSGGEW